MKQIEPTYVSFEQAKLLKEKGFKSKSKYYRGNGELVNTPHIIENDYRHTNNMMQRFRWEAPEQWQVVEWLRVNHDIWIAITINGLDKLFTFDIHNYKQQGSLGNIQNGGYNSPQKAYSAAFNYILKEIL
jgi:hypothetical protein